MTKSRAFRGIYGLTHLELAGVCTLEELAGWTRTTLILWAALVCTLLEASHFAWATCGSWRRRRATKFREKKINYGLDYRRFSKFSFTESQPRPQHGTLPGFGPWDQDRMLDRMSLHNGSCSILKICLQGTLSLMKALGGRTGVGEGTSTSTLDVKRDP